MEALKKNIKRIFLFEYEYWKVRNLNELRSRLSKDFNILPVENLIEAIRETIGNIENIVKYSPEKALAVKSATVEPAMIYFLIVEEHEVGGKIVLIETKHSMYNYNKILTGMRAFGAYAGIKVWFLNQLPVSRQVSDSTSLSKN